VFVSPVETLSIRHSTTTHRNVNPARIHICKISLLDTETNCLMTMKDARISMKKLLICLKKLEDWFSKELFSILPHPHGYRKPPGFLPSVRRTMRPGVQQSDCQAGHSPGDSGVRNLPIIFAYAYVAKHSSTGNDLICVLVPLMLLPFPPLVYLRVCCLFLQTSYCCFMFCLFL